MTNQPAPKKPHRIADFGFKPGQSGNPGGRPKGLMSRAREATGDGKLLIDFWCDVVCNEKAKTSDRLEASRLLREAGFGKAIGVELSADLTPTHLDGLDIDSEGLIALARHLKSEQARQKALAAEEAANLNRLESGSTGAGGPVAVSGAVVDGQVIEIVNGSGD